jgi:adenylate kinase family enzyme
MEERSIPIIYLTGAAACGKGTLGKMLADKYGLYHLSIGDIRRDFLRRVQEGGIGHISDEIDKYIKARKVIPEDLLKQPEEEGELFLGKYKRVPAILPCYNRYTQNLATFPVVPAIIRENIGEAQSQSQYAVGKGKGIKRHYYKAMLIDGLPVTTGELNQKIVAEFKDQFSGLTIVVECPENVARSRYVERKRLETDDEEKFERRMERTGRSLPPFLALMEGRYGSTMVKVVNDGSRTVEQVFEDLEKMLMRCEIFGRIIGGKA